MNLFEVLASKPCHASIGHSQPRPRQEPWPAKQRNMRCFEVGTREIQLGQGDFVSVLVEAPRHAWNFGEVSQGFPRLAKLLTNTARGWVGSNIVVVAPVSLRQHI